MPLPGFTLWIMATAELVPAEVIVALAREALPGRVRLTGDVVTLIDETGRPRACVLGAYEPRARAWWLSW